jgi:glycine cleavage system aminomethyltransferase T/glycine/D-amino acid oxidase-like deaminating enzyme
MSLSNVIPKHARVVVIGGGVIGTSVAYHLSLNKDWKDVVLLEQGTLTCGTTWHAAGLIGQMRNTSAEIALSKYGSELYETLAKKGYSTSWKRCGSISLSSTSERLIALKRNLGRARSFGIEAEIISGKEAYEKCPHFDPSDVNAALWLPNDGTAVSSDCTMALANAAKDNGVKIFENTRMTGYSSHNGKINGVKLKDKEIECEVAVICSGLWTKNLIPYTPLHPCYHMYIITESDNIPGNIPFLRDLDGLLYAREWSGGMCIGGFELNAKPCFVNENPGVLQFHLFNEDWDQFHPILESAIKRLPIVNKVGIRQFLNGPESFTSDNAYILGEYPYIDNLYMAAGFNSSGIASAGGAGLALSEWIIHGRPTRDLWTVDPRRFAKFHGSNAFLLDRVTETLGLHYSIPFPFREFKTARGLRLSSLYEILKSKGAQFGNKFGWERPNVFMTETVDLNKWIFDERTHNAIREEHLNTRKNVSIFDQTSFSKYLLQGKDALKAMQLLCCNNIDVKIGKMVYTPMLNEQGGYEADITTTRLEEDEFFIMSATANSVRDITRIKKILKRNKLNASIIDITSSYSILSLMGPNSKKLLEKITDKTIDLQFANSIEFELGMAVIRLNRITYVGTHGYELITPTDMTVYIYNLIQQYSKEFGLKDAGYYCIESMRLEKGYRAWAHELKSDITPYEAGCGFTVDMKKEDFIGKEALEAKGQAVQKRIVSFILETYEKEFYMLGDEPVYNSNKQLIGYVTSARFGHSLDRWLGLCLISTDGKPFKASSNYSIEVFGKRVTARLSIKPPYDPSNAEILNN